MFYKKAKDLNIYVLHLIYLYLTVSLRY